MLILSQKGNSVINSDRFDAITVLEDGKKIFAVSGREQPRTLGGYKSDKAAQGVFNELFEFLIKGAHFYKMPSIDQAEDRFNSEPDHNEHWHHATGKKLKRHGGS